MREETTWGSASRAGRVETPNADLGVRVRAIQGDDSARLGQYLLCLLHHNADRLCGARKCCNFGPFSPRGVPEVVLLLQIEPKARLGAERVREAQSHGCGNRSAAVDQSRERRPRNFQALCGFAHRHSTEILAKQLTRVARVVHHPIHRLSPHSSVVIPIIDENRIFILKREGHSPIAIDLH